jgi:hypothetical protein
MARTNVLKYLIQPELAENFLQSTGMPDTP